MIKHNLNKMTLGIFQPHIITKNIQVFNNYMKLLTTFNARATIHKGFLHNQEINTKILNNLHNRYGSGVGSLLYLVKYAQPRLSNTVHELSECVDKENMSHYKDFVCSIPYVIDTK